MAKKPAPKQPGQTARRSKAWKATRIPEAYFHLLDELAAEHYSDVQDEVRIAIREYLERHGKLEAPSPQIPPVAR